MIDAGILYEMSNQERNEECQGDYHEEWKASDSGDMSHVWDEDVQDRKELKPILWESGLTKAGYPLTDIQPFLLSTTHNGLLLLGSTKCLIF